MNLSYYISGLHKGHRTYMKSKNINLRLIIEGCIHENEQSQRKLYEHYYGYGINVALLYVKKLTEAEEIYNDAFLKVFKNLEKYDPQYHFKAWLKTIIVNTAIDYYRKFKKFNSMFTDGIPDEIPEEYPELLPIESTDDFLPILQQLSPAYKLVFNLYVIEEYKHHEIAKKLDISVGTSKSNLARAKSKLKELWLKKKVGQSKKDKHG